jgi:hypothetical protein
MRKFSFASVNMRRRNAAMHALLNDNEGEDVLFVQEPWFNPVGTARCDTMYQGCHGSDGKVPDSAVMTTRAGSILVMDYS